MGILSASLVDTMPEILMSLALAGGIKSRRSVASAEHTEDSGASALAYAG